MELGEMWVVGWRKLGGMWLRMCGLKGIGLGNSRWKGEMGWVGRISKFWGLML